MNARCDHCGWTGHTHQLSSANSHWYCPDCLHDESALTLSSSISSPTKQDGEVNIVKKILTRVWDAVAHRHSTLTRLEQSKVKAFDATMSRR